MTLSSRNIGLALLLAAAGLILILVALMIHPGPLVIDTTEGAAHILISADRHMVNNLGECVTVSWSVENIQTIYFNREPAVGEGSRSVCIDGQTVPTLDVTFSDGKVRQYKLNIGTLVANPISWLLAFGAVMLIFVGSYLLVAAWISRGLATGRAALRSVARGLALFAFGLLATLLVLELGLRFYFSRFGTEDERVQYVYSAEEIQQKAGRFTGLPYVGYGPSPHFPEHNRLGYRGEEVQIPKPEGVFRIVSLGASTTYGFGVQPDEAYPAQLQKILREDYGYANVEVVNAGVMGYTSWETLSNFEFRVLELQPDLVIFYEATNDVEVRATSPGCFGGEQPLRGLNVFHGLWKTQYEPLSPSTLYRFLAVRLGWMEHPNALEFAFAAPPVAADCMESVPVKPEEAVAQNPPVYFERNLRSLVAIAQANNIAVVLSRWIYPTSDLVPFALPDYWLRAVDEHNAIITRLAEEMQVSYYDLAADFKQESDEWWSGVHMTAKGTRQQASLYAAFLDKQGLIPKSNS